MASWPDFPIMYDSISYDVKPFLTSATSSSGRLRQRALIDDVMVTYSFSVFLDETIVDGELQNFIEFIKLIKFGEELIENFEIFGETFDAELIPDSVSYSSVAKNLYIAKMSVRTLTRDWAYVEGVLDDVMELGGVDAYYAEIPNIYDPPDPFDPPESITWPADNLKTEKLAISYLKNVQGWTYAHAVLGALTKVDDAGAYGPNMSGLKAVRYQREAIWINRNAFTVSDAAYANRCALAMAWAFARQDATEGWFQNGLGVAPLPAIESDVFFMNGHLQAHALVASESSLAGLAANYQSLVTNGKVGLAMEWIYDNSAQILDDGEDTPNRLLFASVALELAAMILSNLSYRTQAKDTYYADATDALRYNSGSGYFIEKGGFDTSYQAVSLMNLCTLWFHSTDSTWKTSIKTVITAAATWLASKIITTGPVPGYVIDVGNTRTNNVQSRSPENKLINYPEVALALFYSGFIVNSLDHITKANYVIQYAAYAASLSPITNFTTHFSSVVDGNWTLISGYWAGGVELDGRINAGSWAAGYRPVKCRLKLRANEPSGAGSIVLWLRDSGGNRIASFTNTSSVSADTVFEVTNTITWGSNDISDIYANTGITYLNDAEIPDILEIHFLMS